MDNSNAIYDEEMERAVLGSILIVPKLMVAIELQPDDFFLLRHQYVWTAFKNLYARGEMIERQTLRRELQNLEYYDMVGGDIFISDLVNSTPSAIYAEQYAMLIHRDSVRRRLVMAADAIKAAANDKANSLEEALDISSAKLMQVQDSYVDSKNYKTMRMAVSNVMDEAEKAQQMDEKEIGVPTGLSALDGLLGGLQKSDMVIVAGRPGMGKTSFALSVMLNAINNLNARVGYFSMEMSAEQLVKRLLSMETGMSMSYLRSWQVNDKQMKNLVGKMGDLSGKHGFIDDSPSLTIEQLHTKATLMQKRHGLDLIVIDYIQLMSAPGFKNNRVAEMTYISRHVKELARSLDVPVLALAQLSRAVEQRTDKRPRLADLRETGALEQDSDVVMFIYRDVIYDEATDYPNQADIIVAKHRNGPTDTIPIYFDSSITRFMDGTHQVVDLSAM